MKDISVFKHNAISRNNKGFVAISQLIESHCINAVSLIVINIPELPPTKCHALRSYRG